MFCVLECAKPNKRRPAENCCVSQDPLFSLFPASSLQKMYLIVSCLLSKNRVPNTALLIQIITKKYR